MSTSNLRVQQKTRKQTIYDELICRLQTLKQDLYTNEYFDQYYAQIGFQSDQILKGFNNICLYFKEILKLFKQDKIKPQTINILFQSVIQYLDHQDYIMLSDNDKANYILQAQVKMSSILPMLNTLMIVKDQKNISNSQKQQFKHVWKSIQLILPPNNLAIKQKYLHFKKALILTTNAILMQNQMQCPLGKKFLFGLAYPRFLFNFSLAKLKSLSFYKYPSIKIAKELWNIPEMGWTRQLIKYSWDRIQFNRKVYFPYQQYDDDLLPQIFQYKQHAVTVRILSSKDIYIKNQKIKSSCFKCLNKVKSTQQINTIIIHIHGGGFIALSSRMMQSLTRKWANQLQVPIFCIDYRKPPEYPFPSALNDCVIAYKFIINKIKYYTNINPKKIILAGDSCGGNLACSLMGVILQENLPLPSGLYLAYPTLDLRSHFTPSRLNCLLDPFLWPSMLQLIKKQYIPSTSCSLSQNHPLVSPILLTEEFVNQGSGGKMFPKKWVRTFISVGKKDIFYDDSLILMQKLKQINVQCQCKVYNQFYHGYLTTGIFMKQSYFAIQDSIKDLRALINSK